jgi:hypothetical protein
MKTNFKKLASSAAVGAVLAAGSMSAHAVITSVPGEAFLVPFAVANTADTADTGYGVLDTVVRIVVPASVGVDTVFAFTAPHTAPTNPVAGGGATELPDAAALDAKNEPHIHWYFLNQKSEHVLNGTVPVTPDDVVVFDWGTVVARNPKLANQTGYLVFTTNAGANGQAANFSFFADAYFVTNADVLTAGDFTNSVNIPALPLADGADNGATVPTLDNNVIEPRSKAIRVSPLVSGIRTSIVNGKNEYSIVDLELANGFNNPFGTTVQDVNSLLVVWNDRNAAFNWGYVGVDVFNSDETPCSYGLPLGKEQNLVWVPIGGPDGSLVSNPSYSVPEFINAKANTGTDTSAQAVQDGLCYPGSYAGPDSYVGNRMNGGFVKMYLPEPKATATSPEAASAAAAFTINFGGVYEGDTFVQGFAAETVLGHDRGKFNE